MSSLSKIEAISLPDSQCENSPGPSFPVLAVEANTPLEKLAKNTTDALMRLPVLFESETKISNIDFEDLFSLNSAFAVTIEKQVVRCLNEMRDIWDPLSEWKEYSFVRQGQCFPDVKLVKNSKEVKEDVALGIELKGWFIFSKEKEPSFRYRVSPAVCSPYDLIAVFPWYLSNIIDGSPRVIKPFVGNARYLAEMRNYWWKHTRQSGMSNQILSPDTDLFPYPSSKTKINDNAEKDPGSNFGRVARINNEFGRGVMDDWLADCFKVKLSGKSAIEWKTALKSKG